MSLNDPRVQFYLRHREQFAEWFELRSDAAAAIDEWLLALRPIVDELAPDLGVDVKPFAEADDQTWPGLYLRRNWWPSELDATPSVGLQWTRRKTLLMPAATPWVGVRGDRKLRANRAIYESPEFQACRRARTDSATPWWPAVRHLLPESPFPEQADNYRALLIDAVRSAWQAYSPSIDDAMRRLGGPAEPIATVELPTP